MRRQRQLIVERKTAQLRFWELRGSTAPPLLLWPGVSAGVGGNDDEGLMMRPQVNAVSAMRVTALSVLMVVLSALLLSA